MTHFHYVSHCRVLKLRFSSDDAYKQNNFCHQSVTISLRTGSGSHTSVAYQPVERYHQTHDD